MNYNMSLWQHVLHMKQSKRNRTLFSKLTRYLAMSGTSVSQHLDRECPL